MFIDRKQETCTDLLYVLCTKVQNILYRIWALSGIKATDSLMLLDKNVCMFPKYVLH